MGRGSKKIKPRPYTTKQLEKCVENGCQGTKKQWVSSLYIFEGTYNGGLCRSFRIGKGAVVCSEAQLKGDITIGD